MNEQGGPDVSENKHHGQWFLINDRWSLVPRSPLNCDNDLLYAVLILSKLPKCTGPVAHNNLLITGFIFPCLISSLLFLYGS